MSCGGNSFLGCQVSPPPHAHQKSCPHSTTVSLLSSPLTSHSGGPACIPPRIPLPLWYSQLPLTPQKRILGLREAETRTPRPTSDRIQASNLLWGLKGTGVRVWGPRMGHGSGDTGQRVQMLTLGSGQGGQAHLLSSHLDVVVGCGDDDVFRGEVAHVHGKLIGIPKGLDVARPPRTGCGEGCRELSTGQVCTQNSGFWFLLLGKGEAPPQAPHFFSYCS